MTEEYVLAKPITASREINSEGEETHLWQVQGIFGQLLDDDFRVLFVPLEERKQHIAEMFRVHAIFSSAATDTSTRNQVEEKFVNEVSALVYGEGEKQ